MAPLSPLRVIQLQALQLNTLEAAVLLGVVLLLSSGCESSLRVLQLVFEVGDLRLEVGSDKLAVHSDFLELHLQLGLLVNDSSLDVLELLLHFKASWVLVEGTLANALVLWHRELAR